MHAGLRVLTLNFCTQTSTFGVNSLEFLYIKHSQKVIFASKRKYSLNFCTIYIFVTWSIVRLLKNSATVCTQKHRFSRKIEVIFTTVSHYLNYPNNLRSYFIYNFLRVRLLQSLFYTVDDQEIQGKKMPLIQTF